MYKESSLPIFEYNRNHRGKSEGIVQRTKNYYSKPMYRDIRRVTNPLFTYSYFSYPESDFNYTKQCMEQGLELIKTSKNHHIIGYIDPYQTNHFVVSEGYGSNLRHDMCVGIFGHSYDTSNGASKDLEVNKNKFITWAINFLITPKSILESDTFIEDLLSKDFLFKYFPKFSLTYHGKLVD